jgi:2-C-methyl-D-erythritol 4-phosphate cytidylyltransferase
VTWVVVPAAGRGLRAGLDIPKQYADIAGKPMLQWTLERLLSHPAVSGAVVVLAADDDRWPGWNSLMRKPIRTVAGGEDRAASVRAGLLGLCEYVGAGDWVLVHDAARPCISHAEIDVLIAQGSTHAVGALLALPVADTLKQANERGESTGCLPREHTWRAQTPQMFRHGELLDALDRATTEGVTITDEASAFERLGRHPLLVRGSVSNIKVTTTEDFVFAGSLLS